MAYRADIEIGVKGTRELERLRSLITQSTQAFESLNRIASKRGGLNQTLANYETQLVRAKRAIDNVTAGTQAETKAIREYVTAMGLANAARDRQNYLIAQEIANRRKVQATIDAGYGMQGPALPPVAVTRTGGRGQAPTFSKRLPGAIGGSIIGGAFPLLFGQGPGAAAGGAIGGLVGGLAGPGGSFAGSLLGTLLGDIASQGQKIKQLGQDIGFSASQAELLASAFKKTNVDIEKFTSVIQNIRGLGLELEDQARLIQLTTTLTEKYGGQFDKLGTAITSALESGKVNQSTLNQLQSQGINIQQALADKLGVSRDKLLDMAKKGEISLQQLIDTLVDVGNKGAASITRPTSSMDRLSKATKDLGSALGDLGGAIAKSLAPPLNWLADRLTSIIGLAAQGIKTLATLLSGGTAATAAANARARKKLAQEGGPSTGTRYLTVAQTKRLRELEQQEQAKLVTPEKLKPINVSGLGQLPPSGGGGGKSKAKGTKERESRVPELMRELAALQQQNLAESLIADARLKGDQQLVIRLQAIQKETQLLNQAASIEADKKLPTNEKTLQLRIIETQLIRNQTQTEEELAVYAQERQKTFKELITGVEREIELNDIKNEQVKALRQIEFDILDLQERNKELTAEQIDQYRKLRQAAIEQAKSPTQQRMDELKTSLSLLTNQESIAIAVADNIGAAFGQAFQDVSTGAISAEQALSTMFKNIGENFINMAAQIIAQQMTMIVLGGIMKALGVGISGGAQTANTGGFAGMTVPNNALGEAMTLQMMSFADGGFVTGPTQAVVGEGGEPEYIIPASKMSAAMQRYSAGARGSAVIPGSGATTEGDTSSVSGGTAVAGGIDVRFNVERINSVDYVTADQFQAGIRQAAQQGATQGEQRTLRRLQQSRSTRSRLGMA